MNKTNVNECAVINVTDIQKRIEELKLNCENSDTQWHDRKAKSLEIISLQDILSQSTPLTPILEDAYIRGALDFQMNGKEFTNGDEKEYIENLKLGV